MTTAFLIAGAIATMWLAGKILENTGVHPIPGKKYESEHCEPTAEIAQVVAEIAPVATEAPKKAEYRTIYADELKNATISTIDDMVSRCNELTSAAAALNSAFTLQERVDATVRFEYAGKEHDLKIRLNGRQLTDVRDVIDKEADEIRATSAFREFEKMIQKNA